MCCPQPGQTSAHCRVRSGGASQSKHPPCTPAEPSALSQLLPALGSLASRGRSQGADQVTSDCSNVRKFVVVPTPARSPDTCQEACSLHFKHTASVVRPSGMTWAEQRIKRGAFAAGNQFTLTGHPSCSSPRPQE